MGKRRSVAALLALSLLAGSASADIFDSISNGLNTATNAVSNGLNTATDAVSNGVGTAVNTVGNGLNTAANATENGINTAVNATGSFINTATSSVKDVYNVSRDTVQDFTSSVQNAISPAASRIGDTVDGLGNSVYNVTTGTYRGVVNYGRDVTGQGNAPSSSPTTTQNTTVDATNATAIISAITTNSSGFIGVANSFIVALGEEQASQVESAIRNIVNNRTGNTSYPSTGPNNTISLGLAEAIVTALVTTNNYTVSVNYQGRANAVNATQVADVFLAGLQDGLTPCARNVSSSTNATSGSEEYFSAIAQGCCYLVSQPLTYTSALASSNGVGSEFQDALERSQLLGESPSLDLTRCLSNQTSTS